MDGIFEQHLGGFMGDAILLLIGGFVFVVLCYGVFLGLEKLANKFKTMYEDTKMMDDLSLSIWENLRKDILTGKFDCYLKQQNHLETKLDMKFNGHRVYTEHSKFHGFHEAYYNDPRLTTTQREIIAKRAHTLILKHHWHIK